MIVCSNCGQENPDGFRFCGNCGASLADTAAAREERKVITVLFCDLVGSTAQGERLDPEDLQALLSRERRCLPATLPPPPTCSAKSVTVPPRHTLGSGRAAPT